MLFLNARSISAAEIRQLIEVYRNDVMSQDGMYTLELDDCERSNRHTTASLPDMKTRGKFSSQK
jgi:hypothetical protein